MKNFLGKKTSAKCVWQKFIRRLFSANMFESGFVVNVLFTKWFIGVILQNLVLAK